MALSISVTSTLAPMIDALDGLSSRRINSIIASTLTACAVETQKAFIQEVQNVFDRPTPFTINSTFIKAARADNLSADVGFKDFAGKNVPAAKYLQAELFGGARADKRFERALRYGGFLADGYQVTPGPSARLDAYGNIPGGEVTRILSGLKSFSQVGFSANRTGRSAKRNKLRVDYFAVRVGESSHLSPGIYQVEGEGHARRLLKVVNFVRAPIYRSRLDMDRLTSQVLNLSFEPIFITYAEASIARLMASAK